MYTGRWLNNFTIAFNVFVQARYLMGISEIDQTGKWKNQVFQFSIGYNFM